MCTGTVFVLILNCFAYFGQNDHCAPPSRTPATPPEPPKGLWHHCGLFFKKNESINFRDIRFPNWSLQLFATLDMEKQRERPSDWLSEWKRERERDAEEERERGGGHSGHFDQNKWNNSKSQQKRTLCT